MAGEASIEVKAEPEAVYAVVSDVTRMGEWSPECRGCEWTNGATGPVVGATFNGNNERGPNEWVTPNTVTVAEVGKEFRWVVGTPEMLVCTWGYRMEPAASGTKVTEFFELGDVNVGFRDMVAKVPESDREAMVEGRRGQLIADLEATLARIKEVVEST